jgi:hypothetical protein
MTVQNVTVSLPEDVYLRLEQVARGTKQSLADVLLYAVKAGSPPSWEDVPAEFQADLAALDRLHDEALWQIARSRQTDDEMMRYQDLLDKNANGAMTETERLELTQLRIEADRFMLRKAHAAALLRWRGHQLPPAEKL